MGNLKKELQENSLSNSLVKFYGKKKMGAVFYLNLCNNVVC